MSLTSLTLQQFLAVNLILLAGSVVQGAVGFAAGLFGIPLLVLSGISFPDAVAMSLVASAIQNLLPAWKLRREIDFRRALRPMLIRYALMPLGVAVLALVGRSSKQLASQLAGGLVLAIVLVQWAWRVRPQPKLHPAWEWLAFGLGGFLLGLCGMGGPPMVLWVLAHDWPLNRAKAFLYYIFATGVIPQALLLWISFGQEILSAMLLGLAALPAVWLGLTLGMAIGQRVPDRYLRRVSLAVLVAVAISALVAPYTPGQSR
jgi:uncharacterized membrane protein YfcA